MTKTSKRLAFVLSAVAAAAALTTTTVLAAGDTDDNIVPASTSYMASNSGSVTFTATIDLISVTTTCTSSSISGATPATGLGPTNINDPVFTGCTDNRGGTDTVKANHNNGSWTVTFLDTAPNETENPDSTEPNSGDGLQLGIPKAGVTVTSTKLSGCTVTGAPNGPASITASYDDVNTAKFSNQAIPIAGTGCTTGSNSTFNGTYVSNTNFHDAS